MKPRMSINEVCDDMRHRGMSVSHKTLSDGLVSGVFPFGELLGLSPTGRRSFLILRRNYEAWANENLGPVGGT